MGRVRLLSLPRFSHWARLWPFALSSIRLNAAHSNAMTQSSSKKNYRKFFPKLVSYHRFVELMPYTAMLLALFAQSVGLQSLCTGISFVDTTMLDVCDSHRICQNKVFKGVGKEGKAPPCHQWLWGNSALLPDTHQCGRPQSKSFGKLDKKTVWGVHGQRRGADH